MADADFTIGGNADELTKAVAAAFQDVSRQIDSTLNKIFQKVTRDFAKALNPADALRQNQKLINSFESLEATLKSINRTTDAFGRSFGENFDPGNVEGLNNQLQKLAALQDKLALGPEILGAEGFAAVKQELRAVSAGLVSVRETALSAARAQDEANRNIARDSRQAARVAVQESKASTSRFVVDQQTQASAARDSARQRIAIIQATARTIATIERGLSNIFRQTARVFASAFNAAANTVSGVANGIGRAFTRTTTNIRNSVTNSNSDITRSYRNSFSESTNIVRNETTRQGGIINNFAKQASSAIGGIGVGGLAAGGLLGVGLAKAFRGGFDRATTIETASRGLEVLLGNAEKAEELLASVVDVVTGTPFRLDQFAAGAARLVAFNVEAEKIPGILAAAGDAAALSGKDAAQTIDTLIRVTGQAAATGKLYGDAVLQLGDAGIPALRILGNAFNKQTDEIQKLLTDGTIPADKALDALFKGIVEGTDGINGATAAFGGLAKELGDTLAGAVSNFSISFDRAGANLFKVFTPAIVSAAKAATAAVDLIGSAFASLGQAIVDSPAFALIERAIAALATRLPDLKNRLKPVFDLIADGIVVLGQLALAVGAIRRFPLALRLVGVAAARVLTPFNLLLSAGILLAGGFKRLLDQSPSLRAALQDLLVPIRRIASLLQAVAGVALEAFGRALEQVVVPAVGALTRAVASFVLPALQRLTGFIEERVLPAVTRFAGFILSTVVPAISRVLVRGVDIARTALSDFVQFVKVAFGILAGGDFIGSGGVGWLEEDGLVVRGLLVIRKAFEETVRFAQVAFDIIVRGGTASGLRAGGSGWLAYNGPVAQGLNNIRNLLGEVVEFFRASITILVRGDEFTEGTGWLSEDGIVIRGLNGIRSAMESVVNFAKSNFLPVLAGVGATAGLFALTGNLPLAGLAGITAGIVAALSNDDIRDALVDTVERAITAVRDRLKELVDSGTLTAIGVNVLKVARKIGQVLGDILTDPRLLALVAGIAAYAAALAGAFALGLVEGVIGNIPDIVRGLNKALFTALEAALKQLVREPIWGSLLAGLLLSAAVIAAVSRSGRTIGTTFARAIDQGTRSTFEATGGSFSRAVLGGSKGIAANVEQEFQAAQAVAIKEGQRLQRIARQATGSTIRQTSTSGILGPNGRFLAQTDFKAINKGLADIDRRIGPVNAGAARLVSGFKDLTDRRISDGLRSIGEGVGLVGREIGARAGAVAGGLFAASFISQALFDLESSGRDKLQAGLGLIAVGAATGGQVAGPKGAAIGAGAGALATAVSFLSSAFREQTRSAEEAATAIGRWSDALKNVDFSNYGPSRAEQLRGVLRENLAGADEDVRRALLKSRFRLDDLITDDGSTAGLGAIAASLRAAGVEGDQLNKTLDFLRTQVSDIRRAGQELDIASRFEPVANQADLAAGAIDVAKAATDAFRTKVAELNEARLDGFRARLDEARSKVDEAGAAVDAAKEKLRQFLAGENLERTAEQKINDAVIAVDGIARSIGDLDLGRALSAEFGAVDTAILQSKIAEIQGLAAGLLTGINPADPVAVEAALAPLRLGLAESGVSAEIQAQLEGGISAAVTALQSGGGSILFGQLVNAETLQADAAAAATAAKVALDNAIAQNPLDVPLLLAAATQAFEEAGAESSAGWVEGFDGESMKTAARDAADGALAAAKTALGIESPSKEFEWLGRWSVIGYVKGLREATNTYDATLKTYGTDMLESVEAGLGEGQQGAISQAKGLIRGVVLGVGMEVLRTYSVMKGLGSALFGGFVVGIRSQAAIVVSTAAAVARSAANAVRGELRIQSPSKVMEELGRETMAGFALGIEESAKSVADAVQTVVDATVGGVGDFDVNAGVRLSAVDVASQRATEAPGGYANTGSLMAISPTDITTLAKKIAEQSKPNVNIEQVFTEPVDSRAMAADVAWRLT
jgi:tape measure domain-containing protein